MAQASSIQSSAGRRTGLVLPVSAGLQAPPGAPDIDALLTLIHKQLHDHGAAVSIGCLGALAEFQEADAHYVRSPHMLSVVGEHGALSVRLMGDERACAYEAPSAHGDAWQVGLTLLAPERRGAARSILTELGTDYDALAKDSCDLPLFDLGLGMPNVDYCVRSADPQVISALRKHCGETVVAAAHPLQTILINASPTRVVMSPLARIEVYQTINRDRTPCGSHTHLLPDLLARRRSHAANLPLPAGALPLMTLHPENPVFDNDGRRRQFDSAAFLRFEALLECHGLPAYVLAKSHHRAALAAGRAPDGDGEYLTRIGRAALRMARRQAPYLILKTNGAAHA